MSSTHLSLPQIACSLREKRVSSQELIAAATEKYLSSEDRLNAYRTWGGEAAARQAEAADTLLQSGIDLGPLMGIPVSVKDVYGVPGFPIYAGTSSALPQEWQRPGQIVSALQKQLAIVIGKTHTVEFAFGGLGFNAHWGTPLNPWSGDSPRVPGGSSSGAGVSLIQGSAFLALCSDTAGSVRIPAAMTGQVGLKLTYGRWSTMGIVPLSSSLDTPGLMCRTVEDVAFAFAALEPGSATMPKPLPLSALRIGIPTNLFWDDADSSIVATVKNSLATLNSYGAQSLDLTLAGCEEVLAIFYEGGVAAPELRSFMLMHFPDRIAKLDPTVRRRVQGAEGMTSDEYLRRRRLLPIYGQTALHAFSDCDVLMMPTVPISPPAMEDLADIEQFHKVNMMALRNTAVVNLFGWCALTLPIGLDTNGMPIGLQLVAPPYKEENLLAIGLAVEKVLQESFPPRQQMEKLAGNCLERVKTRKERKDGPL